MAGVETLNVGMFAWTLISALSSKGPRKNALLMLSVVQLAIVGGYGYALYENLQHKNIFEHAGDWAKNTWRKAGDLITQGGDTKTPDASAQTASVPDRGASTAQNQAPTTVAAAPTNTDQASAPVVEQPAPTPEPKVLNSSNTPIESSVVVQPGQGDIKQLRALGDDLYTQLKKLGLDDDQIRSFFKEGSLQDRLVTARVEGTLGSVSERISIETGNYRPGESMDSRNVQQGSRLVLNKDGSVTRVFTDGSSELVSGADGQIRRYAGTQMLRTTKS